MYDWRKLPDSERTELLQVRRQMNRPWHTPPHQESEGLQRYIVTAACYEHASIIGHRPERMDAFSDELVSTITPLVKCLHAWCVLPNHYHVVISTRGLKLLETELGKLHGRTSYEWNGEDDRRKRKVWYNCSDREMRSDAHLWASINYVHNNPVKHGYVERWLEWPWSSAASFLAAVGREQAERIWRSFPVGDYGRDWDEAEL